MDLHGFPWRPVSTQNQKTLLFLTCNRATKNHSIIFGPFKTFEWSPSQIISPNETWFVVYLTKWNLVCRLLSHHVPFTGPQPSNGMMTPNTKPAWLHSDNGEPETAWLGTTPLCWPPCTDASISVLVGRNGFEFPATTITKKSERII